MTRRLTQLAILFSKKYLLSASFFHLPFSEFYILLWYTFERQYMHARTSSHLCSPKKSTFQNHKRLQTSLFQYRNLFGLSWKQLYLSKRRMNSRVVSCRVSQSQTSTARSRRADKCACVADVWIKRRGGRTRLTSPFFRKQIKMNNTGRSESNYTPINFIKSTDH